MKNLYEIIIDDAENGKRLQTEKEKENERNRKSSKSREIVKKEKEGNKTSTINEKKSREDEEKRKWFRVFIADMGKTTVTCSKNILK